MSASTSACRKPSTQYMEQAQKFAHEIDLFGASDRQKISSYFSKSTEFVNLTESVTLEDFFVAIGLIFSLNVKQIADWQDTFKSSDAPGENTITWVTSGSREFHYTSVDCINGIITVQPNIEWQWVSSTMVLEFAEEENRDEGEVSELGRTILKIRRCTILDVQCTQDIAPQPACSPDALRTARKLAFESFRIPQRSDELCGLYDDSARIIFPDREQNMKEFKEAMKTGNTLNVEHLYYVFNNYYPDENNTHKIRWATRVCQWRKGLGYQEDNIPGTYLIDQSANLTLGPDGKIVKQRVTEFKKTRKE